MNQADPLNESQPLARRLSFGPVAELYDRARAAYSPDAVAWALPSGVSRVLDLAAGTGKLTALVNERGLDVVAVDPSEEMLDVLRAKLPAVEVHVGSAEQIGLADDDVDAVVIGSALHWFERPAADHEIARVLRPQGVVAVFGNRRDTDVPWIADLEQLLDSVANRPRNFEGWRLNRAPFDAALFSEPERAEFAFTQEVDADGLAELFASRSYVIQLDETSRESALEEIRRFARTHPDLTGHDRFDVAYRTVVTRSQLLS